VFRPTQSDEITGLLAAWGKGEQGALDRLVPLVESEMRQIARAYLAKEGQQADLQTTEIIDEVFLRLIDSNRLNCNNRSHFYALCARVMRRVLVDQARARDATKRGSGARHVSLDESCVVCPAVLTDILAIDEALTTLSKDDHRKSKVVELRFFGGLSVEETAEVLEISPESVMRDWRLAKVWLLRELGGMRRA
jgi:RNA polymerase sigma factor (TIGR02999 family)